MQVILHCCKCKSEVVFWTGEKDEIMISGKIQHWIKECHQLCKACYEKEKQKENPAK